MKEEKIKRVQSLLEKENIDGWLIYDFQKRNALACEFLEIPSSLFLTRRLFYWIPAKGKPVKIVHATEVHTLDEFPGETKAYFKRETLFDELSLILKNKTCVAMEYSPNNSIPYVSFVDGGTLEWVRSMGPEVVSSASFIQEFTSVLTDKQRTSHLEAADILDKTVESAWDFISERLKEKKKVSELDVKEFIALKLERSGCVFEGGPICAVNENCSDPHYVPTLEKHKEIQEKDFILIDLWAKKKEEGSIYADICRVGVADRSPTDEQKKIFDLVKKAQETATNLVRQRFSHKDSLKGWEVDASARNVIEESGYGKYFVHRTGHNIHTRDHGPGTHMDSLETFDDRRVLAKTCFSIEPGIYLPHFGVRLEYDVFVTEEGEVEISGGIQHEIKCLL